MNKQLSPRRVRSLTCASMPALYLFFFISLILSTFFLPLFILPLICFFLPVIDVFVHMLFFFFRYYDNVRVYAIVEVSKSVISSLLIYRRLSVIFMYCLAHLAPAFYLIENIKKVAKKKMNCGGEKDIRAERANDCLDEFTSNCVVILFIWREIIH